MKKLFTALFFFFSILSTTYADKSNDISLYKESKFMLYQTVNNSVNSSAKIKFYLAEPVKVDLAIYNLIGHKLFQLTDKEYLSGMHEIEFNTENLSNGLYIYKMEIADKIVGVKKMKILK